MKKKLYRRTAIGLMAAALIVGCGEINEEQPSNLSSSESQINVEDSVEDPDAENAENSSEDISVEDNEEILLQILATSDIHGKFVPYDYALNAESTSGSAVQIASAVKELRNENTLVLDAGDIFQDNSAEYFLGDDIHPMSVALNEIGYDAWTTGNHEYNYGMDTLQNLIGQMEAPLLCGNVYAPDGTPLGEDYLIIENDGIKIGIIGMVTPNITRWDAKNLKDWTVTDPVEETVEAAKKLRDEVDVLIALEHMAVENEYGVEHSGVRDLAEVCPELDLIIASHGHQPIDDLTINGVPIVENKNSGATMARIQMHATKNADGTATVTEVETELIDISVYEADPKLSELLTDYHERAVEYANSEIGEMLSENLAPENEIAEIPTAQIEDTALIDLINEVMLYYSGAKVSGIALFTSDANLHQGPIKRCDMARIYKYGNTVYSVEMTGKQLKKWMEWSASYYNTFEEGDLTISFNENIRGYNYDMFSGVNYEINIANEPGNRIENLTWPDGTPVEDDDVFLACMNDYRYNSQLAFPGEIFEEGEEMPKLVEADVRSDIGNTRELIREYIIDVMGGKLELETDHSWKITGNDWDEEKHQKVVQLAEEGLLSIPASADGRTPNVKAITEKDLENY